MSISHLFLWLTASIWGFAFVAQSTAMEVIGPHTFNAVRFLLATLSMIPLLLIFKTKQDYDPKEDIPELNEYQCGTYMMHSLEEAKDIARNILDRGVLVNSNSELYLSEEFLAEHS